MISCARRIGDLFQIKKIKYKTGVLLDSILQSQQLIVYPLQFARKV